MTNNKWGTIRFVFMLIVIFRCVCLLKVSLTFYRLYLWFCIFIFYLLYIWVVILFRIFRVSIVIVSLSFYSCLRYLNSNNSNNNDWMDVHGWLTRSFRNQLFDSLYNSSRLQEAFYLPCVVDVSFLLFKVERILMWEPTTTNPALSHRNISIYIHSHSRSVHFSIKSWSRCCCCCYNTNTTSSTSQPRHLNKVIRYDTTQHNTYLIFWFIFIFFFFVFFSFLPRQLTTVCEKNNEYNSTTLEKRRKIKKIANKRVMNAKWRVY